MALAALRTLIGSDLIRWWLGMRCRGEAMRRYYKQDYPTLDTQFSGVEFLAVDLETTGTDPRADAIVSIGWVPIVGGVIRMDGADHRLVRADRPVSQESAAVHGILDEHLKDAPPLEDVLPDFLDALSGRIPVAHHAMFEAGFIGTACKRFYGCALEVPFVDTLQVERRLYARRNQEAKSGDLRLQACRDRYGLPRYRGHDALIDAIACAELLLAQVAHQTTAKRAPRLEELLH